MKQQSLSQDSYYFPRRLTRQLETIPFHPLTLIEAPSGFGKTTAVREYFAAHGHRLGTVKWYTCFGESPLKAWAGICDLFTTDGNDTSDKLVAAGVPSTENLGDLARILERFTCPTPLYLVIDNYQLFKTDIPRKLAAVFAACPEKNLHVVMVSQPLPPSTETTHQPAHLTLTPKDFLFDCTDIADYCRLADIKISRDAVAHIYRTSEGWIAAIRLQLANYRATGSPAESGDITTLVETAIWNKLDAAARTFMLAISLLDDFSARQSAVMAGLSALPEAPANLLSDNFFIRHITGTNAYAMHTILREYLQKRFAMQAQNTIKAMRRKAAEACLVEGKYFQAAQFYKMVGDYDAILAMPFTDQYFFNNQEIELIRFFAQVFEECPTQTLLRYPLTIPTLGIQFYKRNMPEHYAKAIRLLEDFFETAPALSETELYRVKGEFEMMYFFSQFNDVAKMGAHHKKAYEYLKRVSDPPRSRIYVGNVPWAVGVPSVVSVYWTTSGGLRTALEAMYECLPFYSALAGGHGTGGELLMHAEICLFSGDDVQAEALCRKTLHAAEQAGQTSSCLCAEMLLGYIAVLRNDSALYHAAIRNILSLMDEARQTGLTLLGEQCLAHLSMALNNTDDVPNWIRGVKTIKRYLYSVTQPHAIMLHCRMLLLEKRYEKLYALTDSAMDTAQAMNYALLQTYHLIFLARAKEETGCREEARNALHRALALALPDEVYLPFAEQGDTLLPLLESLAGDFDGKRMERCVALCRRWIAGSALLRRSLPEASSLLTPREREIALLIRDGLSAGQIAAKLILAESTVASVRKQIYLKLNIHSKMELVKMEL